MSLKLNRRPSTIRVAVNQVCEARGKAKQLSAERRSLIGNVEIVIIVRMSEDSLICCCWNRGGLNGFVLHSVIFLFGFSGTFGIYSMRKTALFVHGAGSGG
jgi:hypothetical protein